MTSKNSGFTIIELAIVIGVIGLLSLWHDWSWGLGVDGGALFFYGAGWLLVVAGVIANKRTAPYGGKLLAAGFVLVVGASLRACGGFIVREGAAAHHAKELLAKERALKWGYIDKKGEMVIAPRFDRAEEFVQGLAVVAVGDKRGFIDRAGNFVLEDKDGLSYRGLSEGLVEVSFHGRWGFADKKGGTVVYPQFEETSPFSEGLALVKLNGLWGFIGKKGETLIAPRFPERPGSFHDGRAAVKVDGKFGYIDMTGAVVIPLQFAYAGDFFEGLAPVTAFDRRVGFIDPRGRIIIAPLYDGGWRFSNGVAAMTSGTKSVYIDRTGKVLAERSNSFGLPPWAIGKEKSPAYSRGRNGHFDVHGKAVVAPTYDGSTNFSDGMARVQRDDKYGFIDEKGKVVIEPLYREAYDFQEGLAPVQVDTADKRGR